ncbi:formate--tetrahydrofolate ligase [bacterium]|nr:formate--tetrahydrofolate ligase [bacterium]
MDATNQPRAHITAIAESIGLTSSDIELYGDYKAKIRETVLDTLSRTAPSGKLILVSAITPTPAGEGKTTTAIGLSIGLNRIGKQAIVTLREPSLGPLFGMKGGATGGGKTVLVPAEEINLHFTGDIHAVGTAHNLIAAAIDNHIYRRKQPMLDPRQTTWKRVMDMNDRSLRNIVIGLGGKANGFPRESGFSITASSEIMAILGLAETYRDLQSRVENILLGFTYSGDPVYLRDLRIAGAVTALLKDAFKPNLVQTSEGTPALVHGGPFANIAQGTCSVISMKLALRHADYVVTEAGFGFDLGAEKFFDIVARKSGLKPVAVVLVATVRALKMHGGVRVKELDKADPEAVEKGLPNLEKHMENIGKFNVCPIVAVNRFAGDRQEEIDVITAFLKKKRVKFAIIDSAIRGGEGAEDLARAVEGHCDMTNEYTPLYPLDLPVEDKIETVCKEIYGSAAVDYTRDARKDIKQIEELGLDGLPVCIAKTQKSLSDNPLLLGRPKDFLVTVRNVTISSGAGFLVPITGDILLMPGLPASPAAEQIRLHEDGSVSGIS